MRRRYPALAVPLVAGALAFVWWAPWQSRTAPVTTLARKAFGDGPVVHVLARKHSTPRAVAADDGIEVWYRAPRRDHIVVRRGGKVVADTLHGPLEPSLLRDFVRGYRSGLAAAEFRVAGQEHIEGRRVLWVRSPGLDVAIDPVSYEPLWIRGPKDSNPELIQLVKAETMPYDSADFVLLRNRRPRHL
jgi:hypothetical protein